MRKRLGEDYRQPNRAFLLKGYNGAQTAAARLAGIDEKAGKK